MKVVLCMLAVSTLQAQVISGWAFGEADHRVHYLVDAHGNSIMDFSSAGYRGGGVKLASAAVAQRLTPVAGDNTARIQAALDKATGAVVLAAGNYDVAGTLSITRSGVVLRGEKGACIRLTGKPHRFLEIHGTGAWHEEGPREPVLDAYVPSGAASFRVRNASEFHPSDRVLVLRPTKDSVLRTDRMVESVLGDQVTLDAPLSDALDSQSTAASLVRYSFPGRITEAGVEGLRITASFENVPLTEPQDAAIRMDAVQDGWARDLELQETQNGIAIGPAAKRLTLTNISVTHSAAHSGAAPADFALQGTQILLDRCHVTGEGTSPVVTETEAVGPLVMLNFVADHGGVTPRQGFTTGLLVDGGQFPGGTEHRPGVAFSASGIGWSVGWNVSSPFLLVQQPPNALNWCIGCIGTPVSTGTAPNGVFDSLGKMVVPSSLYLQQLRDRIGPEALANIGYANAKLL
jgi:hypothetical protein